MRTATKGRKAGKPKRQPVKPKAVKSDKIFNLHHPDYHGKIEEAFKANGIQYYCFKKESDMRYARYIFLQDFLQEVNLRATLETLKDENKAITAHLDLSKGNINLGKALEILSIQRQRCDLAFEPDTIYRLASCLFFDDTEVLTSWDKTHNEAKIKNWKEANVQDFFFHRLFQELIGLKDLSPDVLANYLRVTPRLIKGWNVAIKDILSQ
jgi:hypothetical protein